MVSGENRRRVSKKPKPCTWQFPVISIRQRHQEPDKNTGVQGGATRTIAEEAPVPAILVAATEQEHNTPPMSPKTSTAARPSTCLTALPPPGRKHAVCANVRVAA